jgi:prepilin-type processing-associated H-X9-DG protein
MAEIVQCSNCGKRLKLKAPAAGKKLRCPGCKEPFVAAKKSGEGKKKRTPPVDQFDDYGAEDDYGGESDDDYGEPARPQRSSAKGKKGKKAAPKKSSKTPLIAGVTILGLGLVGGLVYMLVFANGDDTTAGSESPAAESGADDPASEEMEDAIAADTDSEETPPGGAVTDSSSAAVDGRMNLTWLPPTSEAVIRIDIARLLAGPIGQLLQNPMVQPQIEEFKQQTGFGPGDVKSITVGVGGISAAVSSGTPPDPGDLPFIVVVRATSPADLSKLQSAIPNSQPVTEGKMTYLRVPQSPPVAIWLADPTTAVIGTENMVKRSAAFTTPPSAIDSQLFDGNSAIQVVFSPSNPDSIFRHPMAVLPQAGPPAAMELARHFLATAKGASLGIDLTDDLGFSIAARCSDATAAKQMVKLLNASTEENKAQAEAQADQVPPMLAPLMTLNKTLTESQKIEAIGDICKVSMSAPGGGKQLAMFIPMIPMMIGPAMQQASFAAQATQQKNNLRSIALALHNFHDVYGRFPKSTSRNESDDALLSWRVHLLPFLGHEDLYDLFVLEEPWDSETNRPLADQMPDIFRAPNVDPQPGQTVYQVPVGPGAAFEDGTEVRMRDFTDGTSNTIMIVEVAPERAVIWTQPGDYTFDPEGSLDGLERIGSDGFQAAFVDGHVETMSEVTGDLKPFFTRNGGEQISR